MQRPLHLTTAPHHCTSPLHLPTAPPHCTSPAPRCALHGLIYLWDLKSTTKSLTEETKKDKIIEKEVGEPWPLHLATSP